MFPLPIEKIKSFFGYSIARKTALPFDQNGHFLSLSLLVCSWDGTNLFSNMPEIQWTHKNCLVPLALLWNNWNHFRYLEDSTRNGDVVEGTGCVTKLKPILHAATSCVWGTGLTRVNRASKVQTAVFIKIDKYFSALCKSHFSAFGNKVDVNLGYEYRIGAEWLYAKEYEWTKNYQT